MKLLIALIMVLLLGCQPEIDDLASESNLQFIDSGLEVTTNVSEVEALLTAVELATGLGDFSTAINYFNRLQMVLNEYDATVIQQARVNTMAEILADQMAIATMGNYQADDFEERIFTGSDAAAKVINMIGNVPGYTLVYHEIPSFVGSTGIGYYVFLVPVDHEQHGWGEARERFFVTNAGEILVLD